VQLDLFPDLAQPDVLERGAGEHRRRPGRGGGRHHVQCHPVVGGGTFGPPGVVAIGLVDRDQVGQLQHALLDPLQVVTGARQHEHTEEVDHVGHDRLRLADTHGLHQHDIESGCLAKHDRLARGARHPTQGVARGRRPDERAGVGGEAFHARLVTKDRTTGAGAGGIDRQHGDPASGGGQVHPELVDEGRLADTRHPGDADAV
jgi:hypothetical protein